MKPERSFEAERPLANHCAELLRDGPPPRDFAAPLTLFGEALASSFGAGIARIAGNDPPRVTAGPVGECTMQDLADKQDALAAHWLLGAGEDRAPLLVSLGAVAVFQLVDRAFGGSGEAPDPLPEAFPLSAELLVKRLEATTTIAIAAALGDNPDMAIATLGHGSDLGRLAPFPADAKLHCIMLEVSDDDNQAWTCSVAFPPESLGQIFQAETGKRRSRNNLRLPPNPANAPFGEVPLRLRASLVEMTIGISRLSELKPGAILPVAVARSVPLKADGKTVAHGTIGESDDRIAIQITQAF